MAFANLLRFLGTRHMKARPVFPFNLCPYSTWRLTVIGNWDLSQFFPFAKVFFEHAVVRSRRQAIELDLHYYRSIPVVGASFAGTVSCFRRSFCHTSKPKPPHTDIYPLPSRWVLYYKDMRTWFGGAIHHVTRCSSPSLACAMTCLMAVRIMLRLR